MVAVDTLSFARRLRETGVPAEQAEAHAMAVHTYVQDLVTKDDLKVATDGLRSELKVATDTLRAEMKANTDALRTDLDKQSLTLTIRLGGLLAIGIGALAALMRLS